MVPSGRVIACGERCKFAGKIDRFHSPACGMVSMRPGLPSASAAQRAGTNRKSGERGSLLGNGGPGQGAAVDTKVTVGGDRRSDVRVAGVEDWPSATNA